MKHIAVVCNNQAEWRLFQQTLQWNLAKQNKRYKCVKQAMIDIVEGVYYFHIPNNLHKAKEQLEYSQRNIDSVVSMCNIDSDVKQLLEGVK
jgi:hypothetical protein